jgi:Zn-dependent peptidase ImmA (M78 family)
MWALAEHLAIPVWPLSTLDGVPNAVATLTGSEQGAFSALTVFDAGSRTIIHNDGHNAGRQSSNIGHELAHALLLHEPGPALDGFGCRYWDDTMENEANWLTGCLLIPRDAAFFIASRELDRGLDGIAAHYRVSYDMLNFRLNVTGARKVVRKARTR